MKQLRQHLSARQLQKGLQSNVARALDGDENQDAAQIEDWLARLLLLYGVPFNYLVPDLHMLPAESLRFFKVDFNWVEALVDGAYSLGDFTVAEVAHSQESRQVLAQRSRAQLHEPRAEALDQARLKAYKRRGKAGRQLVAQLKAAIAQANEGAEAGSGAGSGAGGAGAGSAGADGASASDAGAQQKGKGQKGGTQGTNVKAKPEKAPDTTPKAVKKAEEKPGSKPEKGMPKSARRRGSSANRRQASKQMAAAYERRTRSKRRRRCGRRSQPSSNAGNNGAGNNGAGNGNNPAQGTPVQPTTALSGFLLCSAVVSGWPGLEVEGYTDAQGQNPAVLLRMERLSDNVLLVLFQGNVAQVRIHEPTEGLHAGLNMPQNPGSNIDWQKSLRYANANAGAGISAGQLMPNPPIAVPMRQNGTRKVLNINQLAQNMSTQVWAPNTPTAQEVFTAAEFGLEMVQGTESVTFKNPNA